MYLDPSGNFPILATILIISAIAGLCLTIGGVITDNNTMTAISLTMVAIPALISKGLALFGTTGVLAHVVGGIITVVGVVVSFVIGTTASVTSQYIQYSDVNWLQVGVNGLFAVASITLAYTGIGLIGSIAAGAGMGLAQYTVDSAVFHDNFSWSGALIGTGLGALGGLASGRGAQHFKSIGSNLDDTGRAGVKAILTAFDKYGTGTGYQKVMNLWGGRLANSLAKSISQNFTKSTLIIWGTTAANYKVSYWLDQINLEF